MSKKTELAQYKKRVKIAKACGWRLSINQWKQQVILQPDGSECWSYDNRGNSYGPAASWDSPIVKKLLPDYFNDLNATHDAEEMVKDKWITYLDWLVFVKFGAQKEPSIYYGSLVDATAAERAEAVGKTLNLW